jgi:hypothetical protein
MKLGSREIRMKKVLSIAALGVAGFGGVLTCGSITPTEQSGGRQ